MITFGYKNRFSGFIRAALALAVGVIMVVSKTDVMVMAVRVMAAFILASGIVSIVVGVRNRQNNQLPLMGVNGGLSIIVALFLFMFPQLVANMMVYLIGFALIASGLLQLIALASANKVAKVGVYAFVMPVLVLLAGAFLLARPAFLGTAVGMVAGAALIVYGVSELLASWKMKKTMDGIKDVDFEKVDEQ